MEKSINYLELHKEIKEALEANEGWKDLAEKFNEIGYHENLSPRKQLSVITKLNRFLEQLLKRRKDSSSGESQEELSLIERKVSAYITGLLMKEVDKEMAKDIDYIDGDEDEDEGEV